MTYLPSTSVAEPVLASVHLPPFVAAPSALSPSGQLPPFVAVPHPLPASGQLPPYVAAPSVLPPSGELPLYEAAPHPLPASVQLPLYAAVPQSSHGAPPPAQHGRPVTVTQLVSHHPDVEMREPLEGVSVPPETPEITCEICLKVFQNEWNLQRHQLIHKRKKVCPEILDKNKVHKHVAMHHLSVKCDICSADLPSKVSLRTHMKNIHSKVKKGKRSK